MEDSGSVRNQIFASVVVCLPVLYYGCGIGWISPLLLTIYEDKTPLWSVLTVDEVSWIGSFVCVGAFFGTPIYGWLADKYGRKKTALLSGVPILIAWLLKMSYRTPFGIMLGRFVLGFGCAGALVCAPIYSVEIASPSIRGILGSFTAFSLNGGILLMYVLGAYLSYENVLFIMISLSILFFLLMMIMPETPAYLVKNGKIEEAIKAKAWLMSLPKDSSIVKEAIDAIDYDVQLANNSKQINDTDKMDDSNQKLTASSWSLLFTSLPTFKGFAVCFLIVTIQCFTGLFALLTYANSIFESAGSNWSPNTNSIIVGVLEISGSVIASAIIDKTGRKILLGFSCSMVSLSMFAIGLYFYLKESGSDVSQIDWIPVTSLSMAVFTFAMGLGPVPYILPSEIVMVQARATAVTIIYLWLWLALFLVAQFYSVAVEAVGIYSVLWGFSFIGFVGIAITILFLPETKGKSIESILEFYGGEKARQRDENDSN